MIYNTGTVAINGNVATGTGTNWTAPASQIRVGQTIIVLSNPVQLFQITAINSATSLTVTPAASPALSAQKYGILVTDSLSVDGLAQSISQLINEYDENIGAWETFASTSANQNITVTINGTSLTIPAMGKLLQKGSNGALAVTDGGTGAKTAADARTNLGLGSSATRNAYSTTGNMLSEGDFGIGVIAPGLVGTGSLLEKTGWGAARNNEAFPTSTGAFICFTMRYDENSAVFHAIDAGNPTPQHYFRVRAGTLGGWAKYWTTTNTTKASDGTLKAASPIVQLFSDGACQLNNESEGCTVTRQGVGEYLIEGCNGLNSDASWGGVDGGFDIPTDRNKQPLLWLDYEVNADGSVLVKTFHRTYPESPAFARNETAGLTNGDPVDIPEDQFVSVRVEMPVDSVWNQSQEEALKAGQNSPSA